MATVKSEKIEIDIPEDIIFGNERVGETRRG